MLEIEGLQIQYGSVRAVRGLDLTVSEGELVGLVGPNGAGKSSTLWAITGVTKHAAGSIRFCGKQLSGLRPEQIVDLGISLVPEGRRIITSLTVLENLRLGATRRRDRQGVARDISELEERFPILGQFRKRRAGLLSGGQQQQLAIARALLSKPKLLLLDEPSLGLDPHTVTLVFDAVSDLRSQGITALLVEQNVKQTLRRADRSYCLSSGRVQLSGDREFMLSREDLSDHYLGAERELVE